MVRAGGGVILHNASIDASGGDGPFASYNASKAGLLGLNRTMALELGRTASASTASARASRTPT